MRISVDGAQSAPLISATSRGRAVRFQSGAAQQGIVMYRRKAKRVKTYALGKR